MFDVQVEMPDRLFIGTDAGERLVGQPSAAAYGHLMPGDEAEAAAQLDAYLDARESA